jgi:hypothetical protein
MSGRWWYRSQNCWNSSWVIWFQCRRWIECKYLLLLI